MWEPRPRSRMRSTTRPASGCVNCRSASRRCSAESRLKIQRSILIRAFGRPKGVLGRLGGVMMARINKDCAAWVIDLLAIQPNDQVLEVGFGPGVGIQLLARSATTGYVAGADPSAEMVEQATARNANVIRSGRVDLRHGSVESLPFENNTFDK